ncbi:hypothetical protein J6590_070385 [Homalodisca vitripennis]|nr:hypothetical protein J6590_070385 [Homalodisca vitripennis]
MRKKQYYIILFLCVPALQCNLYARHHDTPGQTARVSCAKMITMFTLLRSSFGIRVAPKLTSSSFNAGAETLARGTSPATPFPKTRPSKRERNEPSWSRVLYTRGPHRQHKSNHSVTIALFSTINLVLSRLSSLLYYNRILAQGHWPKRTRDQMTDLGTTSTLNLRAMTHNERILATVSLTGLVSSMALSPVSEEEVSRLIQRCKPKQSSYFDSTEKMINVSFAQGIYPSTLKTAKVAPNLKKTIKQLSKNKSTIDAVTNLIETVVDGLERRELVLGIFLDLSKAFECTSSDIVVPVTDMWCSRSATRIAFVLSQ